METCEICGNIVNRGRWLNNNGACDGCEISRAEIDQDRINRLELAMREFCKAHEIVKKTSFKYDYVDKFYRTSKQLLKK